MRCLESIPVFYTTIWVLYGQNLHGIGNVLPVLSLTPDQRKLSGANLTKIQYHGIGYILEKIDEYSVLHHDPTSNYPRPLKVPPRGLGILTNGRGPLIPLDRSLGGVLASRAA